MGHTLRLIRTTFDGSRFSQGLRLALFELLGLLALILSTLILFHLLKPEVRHRLH